MADTEKKPQPQEKEEKRPDRDALKSSRYGGGDCTYPSGTRIPDCHNDERQKELH